jgi:NAD(P)-dependent dehydrogenase (short-subunit alcohol dehydrogenase family)
VRARRRRPTDTAATIGPRASYRRFNWRGKESRAANGGLDVVYNNAALRYFGPLPDFSVDHWWTIMTGNLTIWCLYRRSRGRTWSSTVAVSCPSADATDMITQETPKVEYAAKARRHCRDATTRRWKAHPMASVRVAISPGPLDSPPSGFFSPTTERRESAATPRRHRQCSPVHRRRPLSSR